MQFTRATEISQLLILLFPEKMPCSFPGPAIFPCGSGCQSQLPKRNPFILRWLESGRKCNQSLTTLTIISVLNALDNSGGVISIYGRSHSPACSLTPFVA